MKGIRLVLAVLAALAVVGCEGGGVDIGVETVDNSVDNSTNGGGGGGNNPCASYTVAQQQRGAHRHLRRHELRLLRRLRRQDQPVAGRPDDSVHLGRAHLPGQPVRRAGRRRGAAPAGGEGPTLTIAAGNRLAFSNSADYVLINRGSQIIAKGSSDRADHLHRVLRRGHEHGGRQRRVALGRHRDQRQRHHQQLHRRGTRGRPVPRRIRGPALELRRQRQRRQLRRAALRHRQAHGLRGRARRRAERNHVQRRRAPARRWRTSRPTAPSTTGSSSSAARSTSPRRSCSTRATTRSTSRTATSGTISEALIIHYRTDGNRCIEGDNIAESRGGGEPLDTAPQSDPTFRNLTCITSNGDQRPDRARTAIRRGPRTVRRQDPHRGQHRLRRVRRFVENGLASNECFEFENADDRR